METRIGEWNTIVRLRENLWLKIEEPRDEKEPTECSITVHYRNPDNDSEGNYEECLDLDYNYHQETYEEQQEMDDDNDE